MQFVFFKKGELSQTPEYPGSAGDWRVNDVVQWAQKKNSRKACRIAGLGAERREKSSGSSFSFIIREEGEERYQ
jgi:hypothetical protein